MGFQIVIPVMPSYFDGWSTALYTKSNASSSACFPSSLHLSKLHSLDMRLQAGFALAVGAALVVRVTGQTIVGTSGVSGLSTCVVSVACKVLRAYY